MREFSLFIKNGRSRKCINRYQLSFETGIDLSIIKRIEHLDDSGGVKIPRKFFVQIIIFLFKGKDRDKAFNLLNEFCPKKRKRFKLDSTERRMSILSRSKHLKRGLR